MPIRKYDAIIIHTGEDSTVQFPNETFVYRDIKSAFKDQDKVTIEIKTRRKPRSLRQNAYLHMCLQMISDETGNSLETVKNTMKAMYAKKPLLDKDGHEIADVESGEVAYTIQDTRDMNTIEAMDFTEKVRMFARDFLMMELPLPDEQIDLKLKN